jgi:hypothetical protein
MPDCFSIAFNVPIGMILLLWTGTIAVRRVSELNSFRCEPVCETSTNPAALSCLITSLAFNRGTLEDIAVLLQS